MKTDQANQAQGISGYRNVSRSSIRRVNAQIQHRKKKRHYFE